MKSERATKKVAKATTAKTEPKNEKPNDCLCGCQTKVRGHFAQGHDQRMRGFVLRVEAGKATEAERAAVANAIRAGVLKKRGTTTPNAQLLTAAAA